VLGLGLRWSLTAALLPVAPWALLAAGACSRAAMAGVIAALPPARPDGLSAGAGRPELPTTGLAVALALAVAWASAGAAGGFAAALAAGGAAASVGRLARTRLGGQTGDALGAAQQAAEMAALAALVAILAPG
jgi:adenosylcobinamide-GDP ribazoletransferase